MPGVVNSGEIAGVESGGSTVTVTFANTVTPTGPPAWSPVAPWSPSVTYVPGPPAGVVTRSGGTYVCRTQSAGVDPADDSGVYWTQIAAPGTANLGSINGGTAVQPGITIELRHDTASGWVSVNPVLAPGEIGYESDTGQSKLGNGSSNWVSLAYTETSTGTVTEVVAADGTITVAGTAAAPALSVNSANIPLNLLGAPVSGVNLGGQRLTNLGQGVNSSDAITVAQVQSLLAGMAPAEYPVQVQAGTNVNALSGAPLLGSYQSVGNDRILLTGQTVASQNGIWQVPANGVGTWQRPTDFASESNAQGKLVDVNGGALWLLMSMTSVTVDVDPQVWTEIDASVVTAGDGLVKTGNILSVAPYTYDAYGAAASAVAAAEPTSYSAGDGLALDGTTFSVIADTYDSFGAAAAAVASVPTYGAGFGLGLSNGVFFVPADTYDAFGAAAQAAAGALPLLVTEAPATTGGILITGSVNPVDATYAAMSVALPDPDTIGEILSVEKVDATANTVTVTGVIRGTSGSINLALPHETVVFEAESFSSWRPFAGHKTLSSLDARYDAFGAGASAAASVAVVPNTYDAFGTAASAVAAFALHNVIEQSGTYATRPAGVPNGNVLWIGPDQPGGALSIDPWINTAAPNGETALQSVSPTTATYTAAIGDRAAITLGTTTSAVLPAISAAALADIVIAVVAGSGTLTVTASGGTPIIGPSGSGSSFTMSAVGNIRTFQVIGGVWTAR